MKCEFASYVLEKVLSDTTKMKSYLPYFRTRLEAAVLTESLSTLTSCQRSKDFGLAWAWNKMAPLLSSETELQNTLREEKENKKKTLQKRWKAGRCHQDVTVDITCAVMMP